MSAEKGVALILRTVDFSETSLVLTVFTRECGKLGMLAKGGRRLKGPFDSALDLLALCRIVFLHKSSESLDLLTEAKLIRRFRPPGHDLRPLYAGYYVAELLRELTDENDPHPDLFDLAEGTLAGLAAGEPVGRLVVRFELVALRLLGHAPQLTECIECGNHVPMNGRVAFALSDGGVVCPKHRGGKRHVAAVTPGMLQAMKQMTDADGHAWRHLPLDGRTLGEMRGVLNQYVSHLVGKRPRMHAYLGNLAE
ncbi:MAG: DNA repair protein RecO [Patescibacteria group bacterium]|nr:DNA repair protein RecO [Patescibacteria group bacterium]